MKTTSANQLAGWFRTVGAIGLVLLLPAAVQAQYRITTNNATITITGYTGAGGAAIIPDGITTIGDGAFYNYPSLTSVTLPASVTSIGNDAFYYCSGLTAITLGTGVTNIGALAFSDCTSLTSLTIPASVTSLGDGLCYDCSSLTNVTLPNNLTSIGSDMFALCASLTMITIPNSVTSLGDEAFYYCSSLTSVTIPDSVTSLGDAVFGLCTSLTSVTIGNGVTSLGDSVFSDCTSLTNVTIGTGVTSLGSNAFSACISLTVIHFQGNAPSLAGAVFANDNNAIVYYQPGTTGWGSTFGGLPTAIWGQFRAVVTVAANPAQGGTVTGGGVLAVGTNVPISASANSGWTFTGWSDGGNQSHSITVPATNTTYTANFTQNPTVAPPTIAPAGGTFTNTVTVTLACSTAGATIRYTTDSSDPTASSPVYTKAFAVTSTGTIKAKAFKTGDADSAIAAGAFTIINTTPTVATPAITPAGGTFSNLVKVTLSCPTAGATIRYTTNGTDPTSKSPAYVKTAITVTNSVTFKAIAFKTKLANSAVATAPFTIIPPPPVTITTTSLPAGIIKVKYAGAILHATGGTTPDKWSWVAQTGSKLPPGLTLNATTGAIAGKPTKAGTYNITVKATDAKKQTATQLLSVIITAS